MQNEHELIDAIKSVDDDRLRDLLRKSDNLAELFKATIVNPQPTNHAIGHGMTLLQLASIRSRDGGNPAAVLIDHGAEVDLHSACGQGMLNRITEILSADADAFGKQVDTYFPIQFAITASQPGAVKCLLEHGDDPNRDLQKVAYFGWEDDHLEQHYTPWKPIHMASLWAFNADRVLVAQSLANGGADLNAASPLGGFRPIHLVAMSNRIEMLKFLVGQSVAVDSRTAVCDKFESSSDENSGPPIGLGATPLMIAAAEGFTEATACLIELGADPKAKNESGQTAMDLAANRFWPGQPYDEVIKTLSQA